MAMKKEDEILRLKTGDGMLARKKNPSLKMEAKVYQQATNLQPPLDPPKPPSILTANRALFEDDDFYDEEQFYYSPPMFFEPFSMPTETEATKSDKTSALSQKAIATKQSRAPKDSKPK